MNYQTVIRFLLILFLFGGPGILIVLAKGASALIALVVGCSGGLMIAEWHIPNLLREWESFGMPGDIKTPEQQKRWEQEESRHKRNQNLAVVLGLFVVALLGPFFKDKLFLPVATASGLIAVYLLRVGWLVYQRRGKLGP